MLLKSIGQSRASRQVNIRNVSNTRFQFNKFRLNLFITRCIKSKFTASLSVPCFLRRAAIKHVSQSAARNKFIGRNAYPRDRSLYIRCRAAATAVINALWSVPDDGRSTERTHNNRDTMRDQYNPLEARVRCLSTNFLTGHSGKN